MRYLFDLFLAAVFVFTVVLCAKRGFARSVWGFIAAVGSAVCAYLFGKPLGDLLYSSLVNNALTKRVSETFGAAVTEGGTLDVAKLPEFIAEWASRAGISRDVLASEGEIEAMSQTIAAPIAYVVSALLGFLTVFVIARVVFAVVGRAVDFAFTKLPLIRQLNAVLGALVGVLKGLVWVWLICLALAVTANIGILPQWLLDSYIMKIFYSVMPTVFTSL